MEKVVLVRGGWSCQLGYVHWAYVAKHVEGQPVNTIRPGCEKIGEKLYQPPNRQEVRDPKHGDYGKEPEPWPLPLCSKWIVDNNHLYMETVVLLTS